jgi:hypothetical protein
LKDILLVSNGLPFQFNLYFSSGVDDFVWSNEGFEIFEHCAENDEFIVGCHVDECVFDPSKVNPYVISRFSKVNPYVISHFFYPYIHLNLDDFDIFVDPCSSEFVFYPS